MYLSLLHWAILEKEKTDVVQDRTAAVDGDVCAREKKLKFKNVPQYFAGLYLGTHRSNKTYPIC